MITYTKKLASTDVSVVVRIVDSTDGTPETGVVPATSGLALKYRRDAGTIVTFSAATLTTLADAHADGGILHIDSGYYRLDLPDGACASGSTGVLVSPSATGMIGIGAYIQLVAVDFSDTVRFGLTALPNAAADAAGGLPISDAGGLDIDAMNTNVSAILADTGTDGVLIAAAGVDAVWDEAVDGSYTARQMARIIMATLGGQASGLGTTTALYKNRDGSKTRITATVDADGNRTAVTFTDIT